MGMKEFASKLIDIMIGVVLGLGFQWWPDLQEPWQFAAFALVYLLVIDYWIDTASALKKFPPKRELDIFIDVAIAFVFFLFIYSTKVSILYFLSVFILFRVLDAVWIYRVKAEYRIIGHERLVLNTWLMADFAESLTAAALIATYKTYVLLPLTTLSLFTVAWLLVRVLSSIRYRKAYFIS